MNKPVFISNTLNVAVALSLLLFLFSCSPVKKVLKSREMTEKVVAAWRVDNPYDTAKIIIKGKDTTIYKETVKYDSIPLPYPVNNRYTEIRTVDRLVVDTVYLRDTAMIGILIREVQGMKVQISELKAENKSLRGFKIGVIFLAIIAVLVSGFAVIKKFKII